MSKNKSNCTNDNYPYTNAKEGEIYRYRAYNIYKYDSEGKLIILKRCSDGTDKIYWFNSKRITYYHSSILYYNYRLTLISSMPPQRARELYG